jgi:LmbE family N-acetylglucosaminyl deacetylase
MGCLAIVFTHASPADAGPRPAEKKKLRVVVFGAHPDDPESGYGGLIGVTKAGHEVIVG